ncbi:RcpC/CpaB family pilus assembly protein [Streptomyces sp. NPDC017638]|uniref:RcpC/CpaB family pilus assembly protein n=1 Tax=Streptomyces sp. NPDC017638 TaxID=3365004 RepID=UPI0037A15EB7
MPSPFPAPSPSPTPSPHPRPPRPLPPRPGPAARSSFPPPFRPPRPLGTDVPATCEVPSFDPVRVRGGRYRLHRLVRHRRPALAAGLAVTAAALVAAGPRTGPEPHGPQRPRGHPVAGPLRPHPAAELVTAPVRIADAATVRLLRPGDRVDVIAAQDASAGGARVLARGVRVTAVPEPPAGTAESGALVVLSVPRATAARLVGASATARLAVTLC